MKKALTVVLFLAVAFAACAQMPVYRDTAVAQWNAPIEPTLLTGESWKYNVYISDKVNGDPTLLTTAQMVYMGQALTETLTMDMTSIPRAEYYLVVQAILVRADAVEELRGRGDSLHNADPLMDPLGWWYIPYGSVLGNPENLRDSGT